MCIILYCIVVYCIEGVVIAAQFTATFSDLLCSPEFRYQDVNMPIKVCLEAYFFQASGSLTSLKSQTRDLPIKVPPGGLVLRIFTS